MDGYTLWDEASRDPEAEQKALRSATAAASLETLWPFLSAARSTEEHEHRLAVAAEPIEAIAERAGVCPGEVEDAARRHYAILVESRLVTAGEDSDEGDEGQVNIVDKRNGATVAGPMPAEEAHEKLESADYGVPREELEIQKIESGDSRAGGDEDEGGESKEASRRRTASVRHASALRAHIAVVHQGVRTDGYAPAELTWLHDQLECRGHQRWGGRAPVRHVALDEGQNPLGWLETMNGGSGRPEKPDGHTTDYSGDGSYSEIPMGPLSGPDPAVTGWIDPQRDNNGDNDQGQVNPDDHLARRRAFRRIAAGERSESSPGQGVPTSAPRQQERSPQGPGRGALAEAPQQRGRSIDSPPGGVNETVPVAGRDPESADGGRNLASPGQDSGFSQRPLTTRPHQGPGGGPAAPPAPEPASVIGIPVPVPPQQPGAGGQQPGSPDQTITAAARLIRQYNPHLPERECRRIGARMAARHFDAVSSVYDDDPAPPQDSGGGSHLIPKPGGGGGDAAGGAEEAAEMLPELAL